MFERKSRHSWFWFAFWSLVIAMVIYWIARFFMRSVDKIATHQKKTKPSREMQPDAALFI
jgi:hypothetical protein